MRSLILIAGLALAASAIADEKSKPVSATKQLDKSSPMLSAAPDEGGDTSSDARAQDYNSSRSNTTAVAADPEADASADREKGSGMATGRRGPAESLDEGGDYNSSRSNKTHTLKQAPDNDQDDDRSTDAQDYNSSRSNNTNGG